MGDDFALAPAEPMEPMARPRSPAGGPAWNTVGDMSSPVPTPVWRAGDTGLGLRDGGPRREKEPGAPDVMGWGMPPLDRKRVLRAPRRAVRPVLASVGHREGQVRLAGQRGRVRPQTRSSAGARPSVSQPPSSRRLPSPDCG